MKEELNQEILVQEKELRLRLDAARDTERQVAEEERELALRES
jgi:hypothetical protein